MSVPLYSLTPSTRPRAWVRLPAALAAAAVLWAISAGMAPVAAANASEYGRAEGARKTPKTTAASSPAARRAAQQEAANIAELKRRMASRDLSLMRRAEAGDAAIEVWLYQPNHQYYVSVSMQGALRRTLKPVNEAEAWLNFDSFRRLAALGEVGRPVLLGQMSAGAVPAPVGAAAPTVVPGQDLKSVMVAPEAAGAEQDVDAMDMALVQQARDNYARASGSSRPAPVVATGDARDTRAMGQSVETLRRQLIGEEVARLVWSADTGQYVASLTRQGRVVGMLRSASRDEAQRSYDDLVSQAEARAAAMADGSPPPAPTRAGGR